ncbi:uncharacterized protein LOC131434097 [Malaya genurostris]|uniref:uncharacterized protein LOC131434097 n=1 Tax=Malaya genurostris TaxID=325434 RepID=UPI0026F3F061|nr:uncharacterized protein LOC131434097 [Malaya genurostris]
MDNENEEIDPLDNPSVLVVQSEHERYAMQRDHAISRINAIIENIAVYQSDIFALETRREMLKEGYKNFDLAQSWLEQWNPEEYNSRDTIEMQYVSGLSLFEKTITNKKCAVSESSSRDNVRLPSVDLPIFNGANENWLEWYDKYNALIHSRSTLAVIQKFEYLKLSLKGTALAIIDSLPTTESNYTIAYDLLQKRYNNPKLLVQKHTRDLFELKCVEEESASALRNLFDSARKHLRCLQILHQPVEYWSAVLVHLMANKLDATTRREWESLASGTTPPDYEKLEQFVLDRCQMLDAMPKKRKITTEQYSHHKKYKPEVRTMTIRADTLGCVACGAEHFVAKCYRFERKSLEEKVKLIKRFALCFNCLKSNHTAEHCRNKGCYKCGGKHHTSIHRENKQIFKKQENHNRESE